MNYELTNPATNLYGVKEIPTNQNIKWFKRRDDARKFMRHLNLGGGFDSWTPTFMLLDVSNSLKKSMAKK